MPYDHDASLPPVEQVEIASVADAAEILPNTAVVNDAVTNADGVAFQAHEAARRLSAEVRSVTGDVVESVATTSRLVDDAAGASCRSDDVAADVSLTLAEAGSGKLSEAWTAEKARSPPANEDLPRRASLGNADNVKSSVNLSEESSSDSDSDHDDGGEVGSASQMQMRHAPKESNPMKSSTSTGQRAGADEKEAVPTENTDPEPVQVLRQSRVREHRQNVPPFRAESPPIGNGVSTNLDHDQTPNRPEPDAEHHYSGEQDAAKVAEQTASPVRAVSASQTPSSLPSEERERSTNAANSESKVVLPSASAPFSSEQATLDEPGVSKGDIRKGIAKDGAIESQGTGQSSNEPSVTSEEPSDVVAQRSEFAEAVDPSPVLAQPDNDAEKSHEEKQGGADTSCAVHPGDIRALTDDMRGRQSDQAHGADNSELCLASDTLGSRDVDSQRRSGDQPDCGSADGVEPTSPRRTPDNATVSFQPVAVGYPPGGRGLSQAEETREVTCDSGNSKNDARKESTAGPADKSTPPECTTSGIRGSTTSSSISEGSPPQDSPSCQQGPSVEASKPNNSLVNYDLGSDSDEESDGAGPSEAAAKDVALTNQLELLSPASGTARPDVDDAAGSSDDPVVTAVGRAASDDRSRHGGFDVSSSLRTSLASGPGTINDGAGGAEPVASLDVAAATASKKSEVTSSSDQPHQGSGTASVSVIEVGIQLSAEAAADVGQELEPALLARDDAESTGEQVNQADASSSDDKAVSDDRQSESQSDYPEEARPGAFRDGDPSAEHQHAASSSSDAALANETYDKASSSIVISDDQASHVSDRSQTQPRRRAALGDEACSSSDKRTQLSPKVQDGADEVVEEASSSGDASRTEGLRAATDVQSSSEACSGQQPVCAATSSDDVADENSAAESSFQGATPPSSAASTPGGYVGSSSPLPPSSAAVQQDSQTSSEQRYCPDASASETAGGASSSSDKKTTITGQRRSSLQSSPSSNEGDGAMRDESYSREARAVADDFPGSEASAASGARCSKAREDPQQDLCSKAQPSVNEDDREGKRSCKTDAAIAVADTDGRRDPDASDAAKNISSSEETTVSGGSRCVALGDAMSSGVAPSDAVSDNGAVNDTRLCEEAGRERCQSTSEQRPMSRPPEGEDDADMCNVLPEGSLPCSSSNSAAKPHEKATSVATDDDRDISSSNANSTNRRPALAAGEAENVSGSSTSGPDAGGGHDTTMSCADGDKEAEARTRDSRQDISSSQVASPGARNVNFATDPESKVSAVSAGGQCSSSESNCAVVTEKSQHLSVDGGEVTDQVGQSIPCQQHDADTEVETEQLASSSAAACLSASSSSAAQTNRTTESPIDGPAIAEKAEDVHAASDETQAAEDKSNERPTSNETDDADEQLDNLGDPLEQTGQQHTVQAARDNNINTASDSSVPMNSPANHSKESALSSGMAADEGENLQGTDEIVRTSDRSPVDPSGSCAPAQEGQVLKLQCEDPTTFNVSTNETVASQRTEKPEMTSESVLRQDTTDSETLKVAAILSTSVNNTEPSIEPKVNEDDSQPTIDPVSEGTVGQQKSANPATCSTTAVNKGPSNSENFSQASEGRRSSIVNVSARSEELLATPAQDERRPEMSAWGEEPSEEFAQDGENSKKPTPIEKSLEQPDQGKRPSAKPAQDEKSVEKFGQDEQAFEKLVDQETSEEPDPDEGPLEKLLEQPSDMPARGKEPSEEPAQNGEILKKPTPNEKPFDQPDQDKRPLAKSAQDEESVEKSVEDDQAFEQLVDQETSEEADQDEGPLEKFLKQHSGMSARNEKRTQDKEISKKPTPIAKSLEQPDQDKRPSAKPAQDEKSGEDNLVFEKLVDQEDSEEREQDEGLPERLLEEFSEMPTRDEEPSEKPTQDEEISSKSTPTEKYLKQPDQDKRPLAKPVQNEKSVKRSGEDDQVFENLVDQETPEKPGQDERPLEKLLKQPPEMPARDEEPLIKSAQDEEISKKPIPNEGSLEQPDQDKRPLTKPAQDEEVSKKPIPNERSLEQPDQDKRPLTKPAQDGKSVEKFGQDEQVFEKLVDQETSEHPDQDEGLLEKLLEQPSEMPARGKEPSEKPVQDEEISKKPTPNEKPFEQSHQCKRPLAKPAQDEKSGEDDQVFVQLVDQETSEEPGQDEGSVEKFLKQPSEMPARDEEPSEKLTQDGKISKKPAPIEKPLEQPDQDKRPLAKPAQKSVEKSGQDEQVFEKLVDQESSEEPDQFEGLLEKSAGHEETSAQDKCTARLGQGEQPLGGLAPDTESVKMPAARDGPISGTPVQQQDSSNVSVQKDKLLEIFVQEHRCSEVAPHDDKSLETRVQDDNSSLNQAEKSSENSVLENKPSPIQGERFSETHVYDDKSTDTSIQNQKSVGTSALDKHHSEATGKQTSLALEFEVVTTSPALPRSDNDAAASTQGNEHPEVAVEGDDPSASSGVAANLAVSAEHSNEISKPPCEDANSSAIAPSSALMTDGNRQGIIDPESAAWVKKDTEEASERRVKEGPPTIEGRFQEKSGSPVQRLTAKSVKKDVHNSGLDLANAENAPAGE
ncbi:hypothetical protein BIW11_11549 [Tropilaelaps mercedesae]|uniref:Uncharacterized protein n=1 Tax=Tropilaelaps mercedesae TaxID=418985 RepID=A0A1V9XAK7_9ACAR|nr:hypothetical protein BIW11_11549 [Tropilaelaps mercedesae]